MSGHWKAWKASMDGPQVLDFMALILRKHIFSCFDNLSSSQTQLLNPANFRPPFKGFSICFDLKSFHYIIKLNWKSTTNQYAIGQCKEEKPIGNEAFKEEKESYTRGS